MKRKFCFSGIAAAAIGCFSFAQAKEKPNIIFILADDMGYGDVGFNGHAAPGVRTPHLDRLAREGMVLADFHSNGAACTPTRAALLTGRYQQRSGLVNALFVGNEGQRGHGLAPVEVLIPRALKQAGYATAVFGKWHVGSEPASHPVRQGFDEFIGNIEGHVDYISRWNRKFFDWQKGFEPFEDEGYVTHQLTRYTLDFIERHQDRPFFVYLSHACPHTPHMLPDDEPMYGTSNPKTTVQPEKYYPMIEEMDRGVGEILAKLDALGLDRRTLVVFTTDNGAHPKAGSAGPFRGHKGDLFEGGHRVPFAARWPGAIPAGAVSGATAMGMDLMPTFLEMAGLPPPQERPLDGLSLLPVLKGQGTLPPRKLFWENGRNRAARDGAMKWVATRAPAGRGWEEHLFDLGSDPGERRNLATERPEAAARLRAAFERWYAEVLDGAVRQPFQESRPQPAPAEAPGGGKVLKGDYQGMPFQLYVPDLAEGRKAPLVVCLHGALGRGDDNAGRGILAYDVLRSPGVQAKHPCFLLVPQCAAGKRWAETDWGKGAYDLAEVPEGDQMEKLRGLVRRIATHRPVDPARIYATGQSMGGFGTWDLVLREPDRFAAAVPICGGGSPAHAHRIKDVAVWAFHGAQDKVVPVSASRGMVAALRAAGGRVEYTEFAEGGHVVMEEAWATPGLVDWLFAQRREAE